MAAKKKAAAKKAAGSRPSKKSRPASASSGGTGRSKKDVAYDEKAIQTLDGLEHIR